MPNITIKPHHEICPEGASFTVDPGISVCDAMRRNGVDIEHACEKSCACTTCHVHVREGGESIDEADELEEDYLGQGLGTGPGFPIELPGYCGGQGSDYRDSQVHHQYGV